VIAWAGACRERGMGIIASNRKQCILHLNIKWEGERMEKVAKMEYLGTIMSVNGKIDT